jgi:acetyltransferase-like isoleucine patch superfamily enzyme
VGPWCWVGSDNRLRSHEGSLRLGAKVVMGRDNVVNSYLDVEIGRNALLGDWIYVCDFDHAHDRLDVPIRKQGLVKTPVRIGEDVWVGEKASILRGADIGSGSVIGSQSLVKGPIPPFSIVAGTPARVIRSRLPKGMTVAEGLALQRAGTPIPGDPLDG